MSVFLARFRGDRGDLRLKDAELRLVKVGNLYHLLWFSDAHTTKGGFVPSNLVFSKRMLPEAWSEGGVC
jgi:hypothetical protein